MKLHQNNLTLINLKRKKVTLAPRVKQKKKKKMIHSLALCYHSNIKRMSFKI